MGLARKSSRIIQVDGRTYRWCISGSNQAARGEVTLIVELNEKPRQRLAVLIPCRNCFLDFPQLDQGRDPVPEDADEYRPITPAQVSNIIRAAIAQKWTPGARATPIRFRLARHGNLQQVGNSHS